MVDGQGVAAAARVLVVAASAGADAARWHRHSGGRCGGHRHIRVLERLRAEECSRSVRVTEVTQADYGVHRVAMSTTAHRQQQRHQQRKRQLFVGVLVWLLLLLLLLNVPPCVSHTHTHTHTQTHTDFVCVEKCGVVLIFEQQQKGKEERPFMRLLLRSLVYSFTFNKQNKTNQNQVKSSSPIISREHSCVCVCI